MTCPQMTANKYSISLMLHKHEFYTHFCSIKAAFVIHLKNYICKLLLVYRSGDEFCIMILYQGSLAEHIICRFSWLRIMTVISFFIVFKFYIYISYHSCTMMNINDSEHLMFLFLVEYISKVSLLHIMFIIHLLFGSLCIHFNQIGFPVLTPLTAYWYHC